MFTPSEIHGGLRGLSVKRSSFEPTGAVVKRLKKLRWSQGVLNGSFYSPHWPIKSPRHGHINFQVKIPPTPTWFFLAASGAN
jgi:hypothetical protein